MKKFFLLLSLVVITYHSFGQVVVDSSLLLSQKDMQWWKDAKFGLFIHFGLYSVLGQGEWAMFYKRMDTAEYGQLKDSFTVAKFSGKNWVNAAKQAGARYMVVTSRHHDGFSLFNTSFGNYNSMNAPVKKDLIKEYVDAAHNAGMKAGIYYSPLDWRYPGFFFPDLYYSNAMEMKKQTYTQVRELLSNYGKIDILWYDGGEDNWLGFGGLMWDGGKGWYTRGFDKPYKGKFSWEPVKLNTMVRELQPKIVINPRSGWMGDFNTQEVGLRGRESRPWELCTNLSGGAWGWTPSAKDHVMTLDSCIRLLVSVVCQDGNLLLNVGPKADGEIEPAQVQRLKEMGDFLSRYGESIYNTRGGVWDANWGGTTLTDDAIYVHVLRVPSNGRIVLPAVSRKISSVKYLGTDEKISCKQSEAEIVLDGIVDKENRTDVIVKVSLGKKVNVTDSAAYVKDIMANKSKYVHKELGVLLKDLTIPVRSYTSQFKFSDRFKCAGIMLSFDEPDITMRKYEGVAGAGTPAILYVEWETPQPRKDVEAQLKRAAGSWGSSEEAYYSKIVIKDIR